MTPEEREALRRAAEEATPGPWRETSFSQVWTVSTLDTGAWWIADTSEKDAAFIAATLRHCGCLLNVQIAKEALAALAALPAPVPEGVPEDRLVPDGWRVEWLVEEPEGPGCGPRRTPYLDEIPMAADTPHEEGEQP